MSKLLLIFALIGAAVAEIAQFQNCEGYSNEVCEVSEVRITPCKSALRCRLKKGTSPSISFDFTPKFSSDKLTTGLFWASPTGDIPFPEVQDADACSMTSCPLESGKKQELDYGLKLSKKLPNGRYIFKWKLWNPDNKNEGCCFKTEIELKK